MRPSLGLSKCNRVTRMPLATEALLCKQTIDNCWTNPAHWQHLSDVLSVRHCWASSVKKFHLDISKSHDQHVFSTNQMAALGTG